MTLPRERKMVGFLRAFETKCGILFTESFSERQLNKHPRDSSSNSDVSVEQDNFTWWLDFVVSRG